ncbi:GspE/PulE family protein [Pseudoteredinibacter isoporae]|uniref:General secretion pathway protein E n=1 Tax=Pseudoteredinibacter isoporae TaxID=570281 RepID=A0A7X0JTG4_9GAMM|nr:ATPase, T2SS/T4P/T4SS family [Pseudoteredinibacter isoporae]MBB6521549.1 general secretion pathway protein E [Pseudoteredinibacter isoporae]NHO87103.1 Flp pilus assembly complex ATPase component TadA [Pseudoteredinibacter isoporae]NIB22927.1 Flp pilus assembly complex ATPase component TadA [Pseudoteredinibacter isoporae]
MDKLSFEFANREGLFISHSDSSNSRVIMREGASLDALLEIQRRFPHGLELLSVSEPEFQQKLQNFYQAQSEDFEDSIFESEQLWREEDIELLAEGDEAPITKLFNRMLSQAIRRKASDIHVEPFRGQLSIRFRIDGVLQEIQTLSGELAPRLCSRIKVLAKLDIAEQRLPQDGRMTVNLAGKPIDLRISTIPANHGERLVMRILDKSQQQLSIAQLGMPEQLLKEFKKSIRQSNGLILVTGPTGAGKTSTLYAALQDIHSSEKNILTVEDPIEYELAGIGQVPVNPAIDMGFAKALRAILRQDPDVLMVGEIRDSETANIAVQASLTGHLVLSTLHTNNANEAINRLLDLEQESFLLASAIKAILAQRLLRKLCSHCRVESHITPEQAHQLGHSTLAGQKIFETGQCSECDETGYSGRVSVFELIVMDKNNQSKLHKIQQNNSSDSGENNRFNTVQNSSLHSHCIDRLLAGDTSYEEILRVHNLTGSE